MKIAILGFGREGQSLLKLLQKRGQTPTLRGQTRNEIWILDKDPKIKVPKGIKARLGKNYLKNLSEFDIVFRSPGIPYLLPEFVEARRHRVSFSSPTRLFFESTSRLTSRIIGVTGSKGKSTTATLIYELLRRAGKPAVLAGNIGDSALDALPKIKKNTWVVLELSSFQLQDLDRSPQIAVILDTFPEHQDAHRSLKEYYKAKAQIIKFQSKNDKVFYFADNAISGRIGEQSKAKQIPVDHRRFKLFSAAELKIPGEHSFRNAVMAATVARKLGVLPAVIKRTITNFRGLEHRLEFVREIKISNPKLRMHPNDTNKIRGIRINSNFSDRFISFYNDSASTNPMTSAAAVRAFRSVPHVLIVGGQDKGLDYKPLGTALKSSKQTKLVVLVGENKKKILKSIQRQATRNPPSPKFRRASKRQRKLNVILVTNLKQAVKRAYVFARKLIPLSMSRVAIILSPGAASFDMFKNYADRGKKFKELARYLT